MFTTITAKYPGTCRRCGGAYGVGTRIRYGGRGRTYHLSAECPQGSRTDRDPAQAAMTNYADEQHDRGFLYGERDN